MSTSRKLKVRSNGIDFLRAIGILGVMVLHSDLGELSGPLRRAVFGIFDWSVLAFFLISGYLQNYEDSFAKVFRKRFVVLVVPFIFYSVAYNVVFAFLASHGSMIGLEVPAVKLGRFPHWWSWGFQSPAFQLYFLPYLYFVTILSHRALGGLSEIGRTRVTVVTLLLLPLLYLILPMPVMSHGSSLAVVPFYLAAFLIGGLLRSSEIWRYNWATVVSGITLILLICCSVFAPHPGLSLVIVAALFVFVMGGCWGSNVMGFVLVGRYSGSIYLWHTPLLMPAVSFGLVVAGMSKPLAWPVTIGISLAICMGMRLALEKFILRRFGWSLPRILML